MNLQVNKLLFTKDGRNIGNAIIIKIGHIDSWTEKVYTIKTDYGNECTLTEREIENWYHDETGDAGKEHKYYVRK